ncbi:MAG TPA: sigma-70 family RNA polymerase sigma factor [Solirubrobacteraceae bacterium]|nr:sigma-70 family RNA polymerase sigma factor [Solirubrobacteraceae bacterium]
MSWKARADDAELMRRVSRGEADAFEAIYDRYSAQVFGVALWVTRNRRAAEEATQETFLTAWRTASRFDARRGAAVTWLLAIARNRSIDALRREQRHDRRSVQDDGHAERLPAADDLEAQALAHDEAGRVRRLLLELPDEQRQVIELAFFKGLTQTEIAAWVKVPLGTVKGRQRLALNRLHRALAGAVPARAA